MSAWWAQTRAEVRMTIRRGETLLLTIGIPVLLLVFFSLAHVTTTPTVHRVETFIAPGILALCVLSDLARRALRSRPASSGPLACFAGFTSPRSASVDSSGEDRRRAGDRGDPVAVLTIRRTPAQWRPHGGARPVLSRSPPN